MERALPFQKMHGLGNDFVILDGRAAACPLGSAEAKIIADRHTGVGCDQVIVIDEPFAPGADVFMRIYNSDGSEVGACGNAARCVARIVMDQQQDDDLVIETRSEVLRASRSGDLISVDMGVARLDWQDIPLAENVDTRLIPIALGPLVEASGVSMGNPHMTFFVDDLDAIDLKTLGPELEVHPMYPEKANVGVAQVLDRSHIRLRVWERGAGLTQACGTGACAAVVSASRRKLTERTVKVTLDGGDLEITWNSDDGHVLMTGPTSLVFKGELDPSLLNGGLAEAS